MAASLKNVCPVASVPPWIRILPLSSGTEAKFRLDVGTLSVLVFWTDQDTVLAVVSRTYIVESGEGALDELRNPPNTYNFPPGSTCAL